MLLYLELLPHGPIAGNEDDHCECGLSRGVGGYYSAALAREQWLISRRAMSSSSMNVLVIEDRFTCVIFRQWHTDLRSNSAFLGLLDVIQAFRISPLRHRHGSRIDAILLEVLAGTMLYEWDWRAEGYVKEYEWIFMTGRLENVHSFMTLFAIKFVLVVERRRVN